MVSDQQNHFNDIFAFGVSVYNLVFRFLRKLEMVEYTSNRYKILHKIGEGVHGIVLKAEDLVTKQIVAIKKVSLRNKHGELSLSTIREIKALQHCSSPYVKLFILIKINGFFLNFLQYFDRLWNYWTYFQI